MGRGIYTYYRERLIEIGGNNRCLYLKSISKKSAYDIGRLFEGRDDKVSEFVDFLWTPSKNSLSLISQSERRAIAENLAIGSRIGSKRGDGKEAFDAPEFKKEQENGAPAEPNVRAIDGEIKKLRELKRDVEEIEKETGRYELYLGYPFVFGSLIQGGTKTLIKAPLLLFPVKIELPDENTVNIAFNEAEKIHINHALVYAYAQSKRISVEQLDLEFDDLAQFKSIKSVVDYLGEAGIKIECQNSKNVYNYGRFKEPENKSDLSVRYAAVLGRFPLSNSIYNDYTLLEKQNLTNDAINELLRTKRIKRKKKKSFLFGRRAAKRTKNSYTVKMLDYAQSEVVRKTDESGNMVIYGPPGTGKSQTIVNIITDALCKNKKVLVVSQKKAALDVVYNRLGNLSEKAMYLTEESKQKAFFYNRALLAHQRDMIDSLSDISALEERYDELQEKINEEEASLNSIYELLSQKRPFGLSLSEMYNSSYMLSKSSAEYTVYTRLIENARIMSLGYKELHEALFVIKNKSLESLYYNFLEDKEKNPIIDHMRPDVNIRTLGEVKASLEEIQKSRKGLFNTAKYPYYRQVLAYYYELSVSENLDAVVDLEYRFLSQHTRLRKQDKEKIRNQYTETLRAIDDYASEYKCLNLVLTEDGYLSVIDNILRGNTSYIKLVHEALDNYISLRDINHLLESLDKNMLEILNFAYKTSKNYSNYLMIIDKLLELRIYHEIISFENECKDELSKMIDFTNVTSRISKLREAQLEIANTVCGARCSHEYDSYYAEAKNNKDYLYQISKKQKFWPIRKTMEVYGDFLLKLFPCWLLSPENVSSLLPLTKNLFDIVIFDEASQVFIENTIPTIYRGKNIVVAGDAKQLRPSATFMKRYLGTYSEEGDDYSVQAALEVESLLDLAVARYDSANLTYHYRSRNQELIDFSNCAFYSSKLQIAPNISKNRAQPPIERYKVRGKWVDRRNAVEAKRVVELLREIFATRKNNESIGIITFNSDQQSCIADMIDREASRDFEFRSNIIKEKHRFENGEDVSIFIKNLENVQGDERDIIIFSIGYAENEFGRLHTGFGSLSAEGGENRLNVAITRAKSRIIVVTSIEPEELNVEASKHIGPKLLKQYLMYVRAVASGNREETQAILARLDPAETKAESITALAPIEVQMKERLEKLGYTVDMHLGNKNSRITLAIYDEKLDRYLVGVELDRDSFAASSSAMERDVSKPRFLEARGWTILRVWCRDWWLSPQKVIRAIVSAAEKNREKKAK